MSRQFLLICTRNRREMGGGGRGGNYGNVVDIVVLKAVCCSPGFIIFVKV